MYLQDKPLIKGQPCLYLKTQLLLLQQSVWHCLQLQLLLNQQVVAQAVRTPVLLKAVQVHMEVRGVRLPNHPVVTAVHQAHHLRDTVLPVAVHHTAVPLNPTKVVDIVKLNLVQAVVEPVMAIVRHQNHHRLHQVVQVHHLLCLLIAKLNLRLLHQVQHMVINAQPQRTAQTPAVLQTSQML